MNGEGNRRIKLGVAGLGRAFTVMLPTLTRDPRIALVAAADPRADARERFSADFSPKVYESIEPLCADPDLDAIYIATPHQYHASHAVLAAAHGKHLMVEKPMALTLDDCARMIHAAQKANVRLVVGHSHSFDAPIARTRALIDSGAFGAVRMISAFNFTDFMYRPRRPEELDTTQGGGVIFSQGAHQIDIVRLLGGGRVRSVRAAAGAWDHERPSEGAFAALLTFENGVFATLTYNGYGHFDSDEFQGWIGELGQAKVPRAARERPRFANISQEAAFKNARNYGGSAYKPAFGENLAHQHFGTIIVSCDHADLRPLPGGVMIHQNGAGRLDTLPPPSVPRGEVIDELYRAIIEGIPPLHDGAWAMATIEVVLALLQAAREGGDMALHHQVGLP